MYEKELAFLKETLFDAFRLTVRDCPSVQGKGRFDIVTDIDKGIERYFSEALSRTYPEDRLLGEEFSGDIALSDRTWILDPIDGTYNFSTGSDHFALQCALWDRGDLQISVIYFPLREELYEARKGNGAFLNGKRIHVSDRDPEQGIFTFGDFPHKRPNDARDQNRMMINAFSSVARYRMFGAASVDFAMLACGKTEGVVLFTKNKWDIAPGLLLSREAGALAFGICGEPYHFGSRGIIACNKIEFFDVLTKGLELKNDPSE